jgi:hypothetical protein
LCCIEEDSARVGWRNVSSSLEVLAKAHSKLARQSRGAREVTTGVEGKEEDCEEEEGE